MTAPMNLVDIQRAYVARDFRALWIDALSRLPPCDDCDRPSTHTEQEYPQHPMHYSCTRHIGESPAWEPAPWHDQVVAAELLGALK